MTVQHKELEMGRWKQLSFLEQMANIGSEVHRALNWKKKENVEYCEKAICRALELLLLTIVYAKKASQYKELTRLKEALLDYFFGENQFSSTEVLWRKYFDHFNFAARRNF